MSDRTQLLTIEFPEFALPSGKTVSFNSITFRERRKLLKEYKRDEGYLPEDLFAAYALAKEDGMPVPEDWALDGGVLSRMDHWSMKDHAYYLEVFTRTIGLEEEEKTNAESAAKKMLAANTTSRVTTTPQGMPKGLKVQTSGGITGS